MWWTATFDDVWTVSLLPSNATAWERAVEAVDADLVARDPVGLVAASRSVADCPPPWLAWLAEERSVDEFSSAWPEARRRAAVSASYHLHRVKGTRPSLDVAMSALQYNITTVEWFEVSPRRRANTFRLKVDIEPDRDWLGARGEIIRVVNQAKNLHTKLEALELTRRYGPAAIYVGGVNRRIRTIRVGQLPVIETVTSRSVFYIGASQTRHRTLRIGPRS